MKLNKKRLVKLGLGIILGGLAGLALSFASGQFGSSCSILCNPKIASGLGMVYGAIFTYGK